MDLLFTIQRLINATITADLSAFAATRTWAALGRGVPEAGLTFAFAMMLGVGLTLGLVACRTGDDPKRSAPEGAVS